MERDNLLFIFVIISLLIIIGIGIFYGHTYVNNYDSYEKARNCSWYSEEEMTRICARQYQKEYPVLFNSS